MNLPQLRLKIDDFSTTFKPFWEQWKKIEGLGIRQPPANPKLLRFVEQLSNSADRLTNDLFKKVSLEILANTKADAATKMTWTTRLMTALTSATNAANTYIQQQTTAINNLMDTLSPQQAITELNLAVQSIVDSQLDAARRLVEFPNTIATELQLDYSVVEQAANSIRDEIKRLK